MFSKAFVCCLVMLSGCWSRYVISCVFKAFLPFCQRGIKNILSYTFKNFLMSRVFLSSNQLITAGKVVEKGKGLFKIIFFFLFIVEPDINTHSKSVLCSSVLSCGGSWRNAIFCDFSFVG